VLETHDGLASPCDCISKVGEPVNPVDPDAMPQSAKRAKKEWGLRFARRVLVCGQPGLYGADTHSVKRASFEISKSSDRTNVPRRLSQRLQRRRADARALLQLTPIMLLLLVFFFLPLLQSILQSIDGSKLNPQRYVEIFTDGVYFGVIARTFELGAIVTFTSIAIGYPVAYLLTTLERRTASLVSVCVLVPLFTAVLIRTYGWEIILGRAGVLNSALLQIGLIEHPLTILGTSTAVYIGMVHFFVPMAVFTMYASMAQIDRSLLTAAQILGATPVRAFTRIYFPMSLPGVISASVLIFIIASGFFIAPALLGGPHDTMIAGLIVTQITTLLNFKFGYALSVVLLLATLIVIIVSGFFVPIEQMWSLRESQTIDPRRGIGHTRLGKVLTHLLGKSEDLIYSAFGYPNWLIGTLLRAHTVGVIVFLLAPLAIIYVLSFSSSPFVVFPPPGYSWRWYLEFISNSEWQAAALMSLRLAMIVATFSVAIGGAAAFALVRGTFPGKRTMLLVMLSPLLVPVIILAICLYVALGELDLLGSFGGLVVGHMVGAVPYAVIVLLGAVRNLDRNTEHAASTLGARPARVLRSIVLPALAPGLATAWVMAFLHSFDEFLVTLFLLGRQQQTIPIKMWSDIRLQLDPVMSAASSVIVTIVAIVILATQYRNFFPARREEVAQPVK
jgi:ABC-type spermidine/putrescine transport system permease subunit I